MLCYSNGTDNKSSPRNYCRRYTHMRSGYNPDSLCNGISSKNVCEESPIVIGHISSNSMLIGGMIQIAIEKSRSERLRSSSASNYDNLYFTKQTLVDKKLNKNNNIELDSENCHVEQLIIETVILNREETKKISNRLSSGCEFVYYYYCCCCCCCRRRCCICPMLYTSTWMYRLMSQRRVIASVAVYAFPWQRVSFCHRVRAGWLLF